jgi:hypothetical protein
MQVAKEHLGSVQRRWHKDLELSQVVKLYADLRANGSRHPNVEVARVLKTNPASIRDAIHRARKRGLLTSDTGKRRGAAKGELTDLAKLLLRLEHDIASGESLRTLARSYGLEAAAVSVLEMRGRKRV